MLQQRTQVARDKLERVIQRDLYQFNRHAQGRGLVELFAWRSRTGFPERGRAKRLKPTPVLGKSATMSP